jgi:hypothetical protein
MAEVYADRGTTTKKSTMIWVLFAVLAVLALMVIIGLAR